MSIALVPAVSVCAPVGEWLGHCLGPYHGFARAEAPHRPLFTFEEAERIAAAWTALAPTDDGKRYAARYDPGDESFRFYDAEADAWHAWAGEAVGLATLYPIGEGAWAWDCRS